MQRARQRVVRLIYREHQIVFRETVLDRNQLNIEAGDVRFFIRLVLQNKPDLEERLMRETTLWLQLFHEALEWHFLMFVSREGELSHSPQQLTHCRIAA